MVKVPPARSSGVSLPVARPARQLLDRALELGEAQAVGVAHDRHDEPARRAHRDAEMHVSVIDDVVAVDPRVDDGTSRQRQ